MGPLKGFKMLDLSRLLPGAYCTLLLADLGMEILKIEDTEQGDYSRKMGPIRKMDSVHFLSVNRNKKSMTLNFKMEEVYERKEEGRRGTFVVRRKKGDERKGTSVRSVLSDLGISI